MRRHIRDTIVAVTIQPTTLADQEKLAQAAGALLAEAPGMNLTVDPSTGTARLAGSSEQYLNVIVQRLIREFNVAMIVSRPEVAYRETVTVPADGEGRHVAQGQEPREYSRWSC